jgi:DNA-binding GntR family transcriptional regulator
MVDSHLRARLGPLGQGAVLGDRVFETISDAIVSGRLAPGERVSDKEIAEALDISRTPVREALQHLSWLGLVEVSPNRFTKVTAVSAETIAHTLEYTGIQAGVAIQLAVRRMDDGAMLEAVSLLDRMIAASDVDHAADLMLSARMFVGFLTRQSGNPLFISGMYAADLLVTRNLRGTDVMLGTAASRGECYRQMRRAMLSRDGDAAEQWFRHVHREIMALLPG